MTSVSAIIVTYNARERILRCLDAVVAGGGDELLETIVVDNGSEDGTVDAIRERFGDVVTVVPLDDNRGPAAARNEGVRHSRGRALAFLDNDTVPAPGWLRAPLERLDAEADLGACQCKLLLLSDPGCFDYAGDYLSPIGFLIQRVQTGEPDRGQADAREEIFSAKSAAMVMRRSAFMEAGGFDPDYFIYVEETDLAWRVWLRGYRIVFEPDSVVLHEFGTSAVVLGARQNVLLKFHGTRNYLTTILKCAGFPAVLPMLGANAAGWLGIAAWLGLRGCFADAYHILRGLGSFLVRLPLTLRQRAAVQRTRRRSDAELWPRIRRRRGLDYFYRKLAAPHRVGNTGSYYRPRKKGAEQALT